MDGRSELLSRVHATKMGLADIRSSSFIMFIIYSSVLYNPSFTEYNIANVKIKLC